MHANHRPILRALKAAGLLLAGLGLMAAPALADWTPKKPIEFIVMAGQGGGADKLARLIQGIIQKNGYSPQPFIPINKGGGSGAEALRYLQDHAGDPHIVMATLNSYYTTPLRTNIGVDIAKFTPVARLALDTFVLWVNSDSKVMNLNDYVSTVKSEGKDWKMGGTGTGQEDSLVTAMLESEFHVDMTYIPFKGGGAVATSLAGGHVDSTVNNPSEAIGFYQAKKVRPLVAFTPERLGVFPNVPTAKELGHNLVYFMQRSVVAPPGVSKEVEDFYVGVFKKVNDSEDWKKYCESHALDRAFLTGDALTKFFVEEREKHRQLLTAMGELK